MKTRYNNYAGPILPAETVTDMNEYIEQEQKKEKVLGIFDKIFGYAGKASALWTDVQRVRSQEDTSPYDVSVKVGDQPEQEKRVLGLPAPAGYTILVLGAVILGVIIYKQVK